MYIDPSAGGVIFQALLVVFGLVSGSVLLFYGRIKMGVARFRRYLRERSDKDEVASAPVDNQE